MPGRTSGVCPGASGSKLLMKPWLSKVLDSPIYFLTNGLRITEFADL